jgi:hypothetical protein
MPTETETEIEIETESSDDTDHGTFECEECGEKFAVTEQNVVMKRGNTLHVCDECQSDHYYWCEKMTGYYHEDETNTVMVRVNNRRNNFAYITVSQRWSDDNCFCCEDCSEYYENDEGTSIHNQRGYHVKTICPECYDNGDYFHCEGCSETMSTDHYSEDGYCYACNSGEDDDYPSPFSSSSSRIKSYSFKPAPKFRGKQLMKNPYIGFELEVECPGKKPGEIAELTAPHEEWLYCKSDASLTNGFEIVSHPATLGVHKKETYKELFKALSNAGCRSHDTKTCGLHFHVCRDNMSEGHKVRLGMLIAFCKPEFEKLARRSENNYAKFKKVDRDILKYHSYDRYSALNWQNDHTVEFRMFKGTLKYETFMASMELVHAAYVFTYEKDCFNVPENEAETIRLIHAQETFSKKIWRKFSRFVYKNQDHYDNLVTFIRTKNLTPDDNNEEI